MFLGHAFEPGADVDGLIEWAFRLNTPVLANQSVRRTAQPVVFWMNYEARLDDAVTSQDFVEVVARLLNLGSPAHRLAADRMFRSVGQALKSQLAHVGGTGCKRLAFAVFVTVAPCNNILESAGGESPAAVLVPLLGALKVYRGVH